MLTNEKWKDIERTKLYYIKPLIRSEKLREDRELQLE
jgi:hypothetical protein